MRPEVGIPREIAPGLQTILAPNPGPMTHWGTNSYLVGEDDLAVIDPGPDHAGHLQALLTTIGGRKVARILVTHAHLDHSGLARRLARHVGAPVLGFGPAESGRSAVMQALAARGNLGGGEGVDANFDPDVKIGEGDIVTGSGWTIEALHTPGHFAGHLAFAVGDVLVSGDHVMDWSSSIVSPPDGDLSDFMATTRRLAVGGFTRFLTGHGAPIDDPTGRLEWLLDHRGRRERQILDALGPRPRSLSDVTRRAYPGVADAVLPAAERNAFAHLIDLCNRGICIAEPLLEPEATFRLS